MSASTGATRQNRQLDMERLQAAWQEAVFALYLAEGLESGAKRNFQVLAPLDFLAEFTQHIPPMGAHRIRYYG